MHSLHLGFVESIKMLRKISICLCLHACSLFIHCYVEFFSFYAHFFSHSFVFHNFTLEKKSEELDI